MFRKLWSLLQERNLRKYHFLKIFTEICHEIVYSDNNDVLRLMKYHNYV